jgi:hypothetical protein
MGRKASGAIARRLIPLPLRLPQGQSGNVITRSSVMSRIAATCLLVALLACPTVPDASHMQRVSPFSLSMAVTTAGGVILAAGFLASPHADRESWSASSPARKLSPKASGPARALLWSMQREARAVP